MCKKYQDMRQNASRKCFSSGEEKEGQETDSYFTASWTLAVAESIASWVIPVCSWSTSFSLEGLLMAAITWEGEGSQEIRRSGDQEVMWPRGDVSISRAQ